MIQQATVDTEITDGMGSVQRAVKRVFDCLAALVSLVLLSPLFLIIAIALKVKSSGPILFRQ